MVHPKTAAAEKGRIMSKTIFTAGLIAAFTAAIHIFAGGPEIAVPLLYSQITEVPKLTLYAVWHMVSAALVFSAIALFIGSLNKHKDSARYLVTFISLLWIAFGLVFIVVAITRAGEGLFFKLPQWILLIPVGLLGLWGSCNGQK